MVHFTTREKADLVAFLKSLNGEVPSEALIADTYSKGDNFGRRMICENPSASRRPVQLIAGVRFSSIFGSFVFPVNPCFH